MSGEYNEMNNADREESGEERTSPAKQQKRIWSVVSITLAALSVFLCFIPWLGILFSVAAMMTAIVSRKSLGYFDGISMASLILSIFGMVFSFGVVIITEIIKNNPDLLLWLNEYLGG